MSQGYNKFFKAARSQKKTAGETQFAIRKPKAQADQKAKSGVSEEELRAAFKMAPRRPSARKFPPLKICLGLAIACGIAGFGYSQPQVVESWLNYFEISPMSSASAADGEKDPAKSAGAKDGKEAKTAETGDKSGAAACPDPTAMSEEDLSHFSRLSERKRELDLREQELSSLEEELHKQRKEVEARIQKLEGIRAEISTVLKDRVEVDQQRVTTLVEFYSNMKPKQAADIFSNLNEDLAVEVLGKMKKKNAAEIMNLLPADKARTLSEKFTGYKRR